MKHLKLYTIALFALTLGLFGCKKEGEQKTQAMPNTVVAAYPIVKDVEIKNEYAARAVAYEEAEIRARVGGYLEKVFFGKGATVQKGTPLFKIDDRPYVAALQAAKANVQAAQSHVALANDNAERARGLFKRNAISKELYQTRETELLIAKAKLAEAKAALTNAQLNLQYTTVCAPVSGKVGENLADTGNLVSAHVTKLARIVNDSKIKVYYELNSADAFRYKTSGLLKDIDANKGAKVLFAPKNSGKALKGTLCYYDNAMDSTTASLVMRADIDNKDNLLFAGAYGTITVFEGVKNNALLVPSNAVGTDMTGKYLVVVKDGKAANIPVKTGAVVGKFTVIESGIQKDSLVVVKGLQRAAQNPQVNVQIEKLEF